MLSLDSSIQQITTYWQRLHIDMKTYLSWQYLMKDIQLIRSWNVVMVSSPPFRLKIKAFL